MKNAIIIASFALLFIIQQPTHAQEGFFKTYLSGGNNFASSAVIETDDGSFIVAVNDDLFGNGYSHCAKLFKISAEGDSLGYVTIDDPDKFCYLTNFFRHPNNHDVFIGTGMYVFRDANSSNYLAHPYLIQFNDQLDITLRKQVEWPAEFDGTNAYRPHTILNSNKLLFGEYVIYTPDAPDHDYRRLFTEMTPEGDFKRIVEDTHDLIPTGCGAEAIFEFPAMKRMGSFRNGYVEEGNPNAGNVHKLFRLDDGLVASELNEMNRFGDDTLSYTYHLISLRFNMLDQGKTDILPLNDTTLLFSMGVTENWYRIFPQYDSTLMVIDNSAVIFKTDVDGNMRQYAILGSYNDSIEMVPLGSIAITDSDMVGHRDIYHCCYSVYDYMWEAPNTLTINKLDDNLQVIWCKPYTIPELYLEAHNLIATSDGGCLVVGSVTRGFEMPYSFGEREEWFVLKLNADGTVGTDEDNLVVRPYAFYPNPVKEQVLMQFSPDVQPAQVELYDLQGRLVRTQRSNFEHIDMGQLPAGTYTMRVVLENGMVYSDKVVKE